MSTHLSPVRSRTAVQELERLVRSRQQAPTSFGAVCTDWPACDALISAPAAGESLPQRTDVPGLARGVLHEWLGLEHARPGGAPHSSSRDFARRGTLDRWTPPLSLLTHLAEQALRQPMGASTSGAGWVLWIGRRVWPYGRTLMGQAVVRESMTGSRRAPVTRDDDALCSFDLEWHAREDARHAEQLFSRSLLLDPAHDEARLWAIDGALRCPGVAAIVADGSTLSMVATRRLQLAAAEGGALALIARPPWEARELSAATTRWRVRRAPRSPRPDARVPMRWQLQLLRAKGLQRVRRPGMS